MAKIRKINESFICEHCGQKVKPHPEGSCRDHCPSCLYSKHLDDTKPGDRQSHCHALMEPVAAAKDIRRRMIIFYHCQKCDKYFRVKMAPDDNWDKIIILSTKPVLADK